MGSGPGFTPDNEYDGRKTVLGISNRRQHGLLDLSKPVPKDAFDSSPLELAELDLDMLGERLEAEAVI